jgi:hypothetical protein
MEARDSFSLNPVSHIEQIAYFLHGGIAILKHCAIRRSSTGLLPLAEITHSQYHGRSNALEDKHGVAYHKALFDFQACRMCGLRFGKESLRLLVNLEEIAPKLELTFLLSTTSFSGSLLRSCVSILT